MIRNRKRSGSFVGAVMAIYLDSDDDDLEYWQNAVEAAAHLELRNIGFDYDAICRWVQYGNTPSDSLIEKKIKNSSAGGESVLEPLSVEAYKRCFGLLISTEALQELITDRDAADPEFEQSSSEEYFSAGVELGLASYLIGWEKNQEIAVRFSQAERAKGRLGLKTSIPRRAIKYAIENGHTTGKAVEKFFDENGDLVDINIRITQEKDRFSKKIGYMCADTQTGKRGLLQLKNLSSTVSQVKKTLIS